MDAKFIPRLQVMDSNSTLLSFVIMPKKSSPKLERVPKILDMQPRYHYKVDGYKSYDQRIDTKDL